MTVVCVNDSNKPSEIPLEKWIKKGNTYTVVKQVQTLDNKIGYILKEINLSEDNFPFRCFSAERFGFPADEVADEVEEIKEDELCLTEN
jgi:hypothetical protein